MDFLVLNKMMGISPATDTCYCYDGGTYNEICSPKCSSYYPPCACKSGSRSEPYSIP